MHNRSHFYIGGEWVEPATTSTIDVSSPITEELLGVVPEGQQPDMDRAVAAARAAFDDGPWSTTSPSERAGFLRALAREFEARGPELVQLLTREVGSPLALNEAWLPSYVSILELYADLAETLTEPETREGFAWPSTILREPVGVVAAIVPWNGPIYLTLLKLAPALAAGCTVVVKPAPETALSAYVLAEAVEAIGLPPGVVNVVAAGREVGQYLVEHPSVDKIAFTGSTAAGRKIMAASAGSIKRLSLELGGKSAAIVLDDADLDATIPELVIGGTINNGQACVATTRILVPDELHDEVVERLVAVFGAMKVGDPFEADTAIGPLIAERQRERVEGYIALAREEGATVAVGGERPAGLDRGWYVAPTILTDVNNDMRVAQEEIFGPVLCVIRHQGDDDAVAIANASDYGLLCSVYSSDTERAASVARQVRAGTCNVNCFSVDIANPFGGFKQSGMGREGGPEGLDAYLEYKVLTVANGAPAREVIR